MEQKHPWAPNSEILLSRIEKDIFNAGGWLIYRDLALLENEKNDYSPNAMAIKMRINVNSRRKLSNRTIKAVSELFDRPVLYPEKLYTKAEYSRVFSISKSTISKRIKSCQIQTIEINGAVLIVVD